MKSSIFPNASNVYLTSDVEVQVFVDVDDDTEVGAVVAHGIKVRGVRAIDITTDHLGRAVARIEIVGVHLGRPA